MARDDLVASRLDEIGRLLALMLRRQADEQPLQEFIKELSDVGLSPSRIAELAGTSSNYVSVALSRSRKKPIQKQEP